MGNCFLCIKIESSSRLDRPLHFAEQRALREYVLYVTPLSKSEELEGLFVYRGLSDSKVQSNTYIPHSSVLYRVSNSESNRRSMDAVMSGLNP